jgi:hypothetical protein
MNNTRTSDPERAEFTPCCGAQFQGEITRGDKCPACGEVMLWCRGCGHGEGHEYTSCDQCGEEICPDCEAELADEDAPINLCCECCV